MTPRMPFGKFKGTKLDELPADYVEWLSRLDLREPLRGQIEAECSRRMFAQENRASVNFRIVDELVGAGLRALAQRYHPDAGGSHERMVAVNAAVDWVRQQVRRIAA